MPIAEGASIPADASGMTFQDGKPAPTALAELVAGKRAIVFGIPGAFTGTCTNQHLPSFAQNQEALSAKGIETVICMSMNDISVLSAWNAAHGAASITMFADGNGDVTRALDLGVDLSVAGMGFRTRRFAMFVENGVVKALNVEEKPGICEISSATGILERV
ncbi:MAG: cytochrome c peroxidase [Chloroflexi bacterium]|jgi:peroxiredoxin|nr:MAG: cytochrome c peroxidase [Chloroflexota bacterium]